MPFIIEQLTAFVSIDDKGEEGIMSFIDARTKIHIPMICADEARIKSLYPMAVQVREATGMQFKIMQFSCKADVTKEITEKFGD